MDKNLAQIKQRIIKYLENKGIVKENFFQMVDISPSNFKSKGLYSEIGGDKIAQILSIYTDLNPTWLITGRGSMLTDENLLAKTPASVPTDVHADTSVKEAHKAVKAPKMGNYASDRLIEEKQRMYEAQIAMLYDKLEEANRKCGRLEAVIEELQAQLDTSASRADSATDAPVRKVAGQ